MESVAPDPLDSIFPGEHASDEETERLLDIMNDIPRSDEADNTRMATYTGEVIVIEPQETEDVEVTGDRL